MDIWESFVNQCCALDEAEPDEALHLVSGELLEAMEVNPTLRDHALETMPKLPPLGGSWLAIVFGTMLENGLDPSLSTPAILTTLKAHLSALPDIQFPESDAEPEIPDLEPSQLAIAEALEWLCQSLVAHLSCLPHERAKLAEDQALWGQLQSASAYSMGPAWVAHLLQRVSGDLVALHVPSKQGFLLRYENLENCFHLFTFLQISLGKRLPGGKKPSKSIVKAAKGLTYLEDGIVQACWHYNQPSKKAGSTVAIDGEGPISSLSTVDGVQVILLGSPSDEPLSWDSSYFGPLIEPAPPSLEVIRSLDDDEILTWLQKLNIKA